MANNHWKDLIVWQKAHQLVLETYAITNLFPESEKFNLTSQIRRAVTSIPTNIVEGHDRSSSNEFVRFLYISRGSLEEVRYLLFLAQDLQYLNPETYFEIENKYCELSILLNKLIKSIKDN